MFQQVHRAVTKVLRCRRHGSRARPPAYAPPHHRGSLSPMTAAQQFGCGVGKENLAGVRLAVRPWKDVHFRGGFASAARFHRRCGSCLCRPRSHHADDASPSLDRPGPGIPPSAFSSHFAGQRKSARLDLCVGAARDPEQKQRATTGRHGIPLMSITFWLANCGDVFD